MSNTQIAAIKSLRQFALANNELRFANMCTAALSGEEWALERVMTALANLSTNLLADSWHTLRIIESINTSRPDGAIARKFEI